MSKPLSLRKALEWAHAHFTTSYGPSAVLTREMRRALDAVDVDVMKLRAEIRDLKARLKAVRAAEGESAADARWPLDALIRIRRLTNLRIKKWRKP